MTKLVTSVGILMLREAGRIDLDLPFKGATFGLSPTRGARLVRPGLAPLCHATGRK